MCQQFGQAGNFGNFAHVFGHGTDADRFIRRLGITHEAQQPEALDVGAMNRKNKRAA